MLFCIRVVFEVNQIQGQGLRGIPDDVFMVQYMPWKYARYLSLACRSFRHVVTDKETVVLGRDFQGVSLSRIFYQKGAAHTHAAEEELVKTASIWHLPAPASNRGARRGLRLA